MYIKKFESFKLRSFKGDNPTSIGKFKVDLLEKFTRLEEEKIKNFVLTHNGSSYKSEKNMIGFWIPYLIDYQFKKGNHPLNTKEVHQYTVDGVYLKSWISCAEASLNFCHNLVHL
jgi:hypothetical protein